MVVKIPINTKNLSPYIRQLTENIPNGEFYPQLGIINHQLGISYPIGDWVFIFWLSCPVLDIPNPKLGIYPLSGI